MKFTEFRDRIGLRTNSFHEFNEMAFGGSFEGQGFWECLAGLQEKSKLILHDDFSGLQASRLLMGIPYEKLK